MSQPETNAPLLSEESGARIYGYVAREARKAVLLRRGPSRRVRLLSWDLERDTIRAGQWFKGRIYERRCDLSPDGELFAYFAANHRRPFYSWTAVCRPPLLTALSFFPKGDCWGGGGLFDNGKSFKLNHTPEFPVADVNSGNKSGKARKVPRYMRGPALRPWELPGPEEGTPVSQSSGARNSLNLRISELGDYSGRGEDNPIEHMRLRRDGWVFADIPVTIKRNKRPKAGEYSYVLEPPSVRSKAVANDALVLQVSLHGLHESQGRAYAETMEIVVPGGDPVKFGRVDWADTDHNGAILYASAGCIYRLKVQVENGALTTNKQMIADLNDMAFEPLSPDDVAQSPAILGR